VWSRVVFGARISLLVAAIVLTAGAVGGTSMGLVSGYLGGNTDELMMRFVDMTFAVPFILVALVAVIVFGQSLQMIVILLIVFSFGSFARQIRGETLSLKTREYVAQAKIAGGSAPYIMWRHILPGVFNTLMVIASLRVGSLILAEAVLSYLGVGVPPPTPAWGAMVSEGRDYIGTAWWISFFPGLAIFLTVLAFNFLGDWLRDRLDPRLRQLA
jgi:peptide/nickel transport system permease protein